MRRRDFIKVVGGAAAWPLAAGAQQRVTRRIGFLLVGLSPESKEAKHFRLGLRDAGYSEGRDVVIEWRSAKGDYDRVPELVADLVGAKVDVIVQDSTIGTEVTKRATSTIPIVMALVHDPVGSGLVESLAHPGGNVTGLSMMTSELSSKRLQLLKEVNPQLTLGGQDSTKLRLAYPIFFSHRTTLLNLASTARLPSTHDLRRWPEAGALMSYGPDLHDLFRRSAIYVDRIFKGTRPADLPVEQPTKFELVINLKTAQVLGLEIPAQLLALTDEVIE